MSRKRTVLLVLTYLSVPLLLVAAELGLRLWDPGLHEPVVRSVAFDGQAWWELNRNFARKYFPPGNPLAPEFKPALLSKEKSPSSYRVICLGGSTMFGTPYQMTANIPGILRRQLRHAHPNRQIEVLNAAASAINSNVIVDLSRHLAPLSPDLVVIYMGHNEYYGPDGVGAGFLERVIPDFIQFKYRLRELRVLNLLLNTFKSDVPSSVERNLMREVSKGGRVPLYSEQSLRIHELFERNLTDIVAFWQKQDVRIIVSDVSSNLMFPPFIYDTLAVPGLRSVSSLLLDFHEGRIQECEEGLRGWLSTDSTNAFAEYWLGRTMLVRGDTVAGKRHLQRSRDFDLLKFRAPGSINGVIRKVCGELKVPFVSTDSLFASLSEGGIPGDTLFWEHLHPTLRGYYEIAALVVDKVHELQLLGNTSSVSARLPFNTDSLGISWLDLAYGDLSIQRLTGRWPFTDYKREPAVLSTSPPEAVAIARAVYDRKMIWDKGCYESAALFWRLGETGRAAATYRALLEEYPRSYYPHYLLGNLLSKAGEPDAAILHLTQSVESNPRYPNARLDLGLLLINKGRFDEAIGHLEAARVVLPTGDTTPLSAGVYYGLGAAHANKGEYAKALTFLDEAIRRAPNDMSALALREAIRREAK